MFNLWSVKCDGFFIFRAPLLNSAISSRNALEASVLVNGSLNTPDGLAFDWIHRKLYWTDTGHNTIAVVDVDSFYRVDLITDLHDEPRAIVVDPRSDQG